MVINLFFFSQLIITLRSHVTNEINHQAARVCLEAVINKIFGS